MILSIGRCAERNGLKLICVVFMEESPAQFTDTVTLLDYGFNNFMSVNVADTDTRYMPDNSLFFESENDVFGQSGTILKIAPQDYVILPKTAAIEDTDYTISYDVSSEEKELLPEAVARVDYTFNGAAIGSTHICYVPATGQSTTDSASNGGTIYINVKHVILGAAAFILLLTIIGSLAGKFTTGRKLISKSDRLRFNRRKKESRKNRIRFK